MSAVELRSCFSLFTFHPSLTAKSLHQPPNTVITGFNTDIEHEGVVYHVQTEDKGLESPLILSLVYSGGAILASKRSPYEDLIASGFNEEALAQRLKRQHRLICAAINAGRIEDLKRMGERPEGKVAQTETAAPLPEIVDNASDYVLLTETPSQVSQEGLEAEGQGEGDIVTNISEGEIVTNASDYAAVLQAPETPVEVASETESPVEAAVNFETSPYTIHDARRESPLGEPAQPDGLNITILDEQEFWAGGNFHIRIMVADRTDQNDEPVAGATLFVKILGTTFRPQLYSMKTERDGVGVVSCQIPRFTSGRAAILIRAAVVDGRSTETRRVIHAAR
jgi:hypothetical protein